MNGTAAKENSEMMAILAALSIYLPDLKAGVKLEEWRRWQAATRARKAVKRSREVTIDK